MCSLKICFQAQSLLNSVCLLISVMFCLFAHCLVDSTFIAKINETGGLWKKAIVA
jgi:hypothetical protein